jgi:hypothetical protein
MQSQVLERTINKTTKKHNLNGVGRITVTSHAKTPKQTNSDNHVPGPGQYTQSTTVQPLPDYTQKN